jgi:monoamine oxidase
MASEQGIYRWPPPPIRQRVGIIGAGAAGLYAAMLLQRRGYDVHILEATNRVGGRILTHYFGCGDNQYFEAGAMRIPENQFQKPFFDLVEDVNGQLPEKEHIKLIPYLLENKANRFQINRVLGVLGEIGAQSSSGIRPSDVNWPHSVSIQVEGVNFNTTSAGELLHRALAPLFEILKGGTDADWTEKGFWELVRLYDDHTFRYYLKVERTWPNDVIDFVETVASQTNQFALSVVELVMQHMDFGAKQWHTIEGGMELLPKAMAKIIGLNKITFYATVTDIQELKNGRVKVKALGTNGTIALEFHKLIITIPPAALRMIGSRPTWPNDKEIAIRSMHFEALWKMGMRFKERFWETRPAEGEPPEEGGQSTTDLPIRWVVLPSNGIGGKGPGALLLYAWMTDAQLWLPLSPDARRALALQSLDRVYPHVQGVRKLLIETFDVTWSSSSATGNAMFLPGQWAHRFKPACRHEGNIHFAGEHLSYSHTWISGALESASRAVDEIGFPRLPAFRFPPTRDDTQPAHQPSSEDRLLFYKYSPTGLYASGEKDKKFIHMHQGEELPDIPQDLGGQPESLCIGPQAVGHKVLA